MSNINYRKRLSDLFVDLDCRGRGVSFTAGFVHESEMKRMRPREKISVDTAVLLEKVRLDEIRWRRLIESRMRDAMRKQDLYATGFPNSIAMRIQEVQDAFGDCDCLPIQTFRAIPKSAKNKTPASKEGAEGNCRKDAQARVGIRA